MALHGLLQVNSETIGAWAAVREQLGGDGPDDINTYVFEMVYDELGEGSRKHRVTVEHRYSEGALALLIKGLQAVQNVRNEDAL